MGDDVGDRDRTEWMEWCVLWEKWVMEESFEGRHVIWRRVWLRAVG
jgi:hypothetical protein